MNLAAYARYSSDNQRCESIDEQLREINYWAKIHDHSIVKVYSDSALSGKYDYRPDFEKMLNDAVLDLWDGVVVFDLSRFSRGGEYGIVDSLRLQEADKALLSVTEQFGNDFGGKLIKHVKMLANEDFIEQLRTNVKRGHKQNALQAQHNGGTPPLGYDVDHSTMKLVINDREAEAVRQIFGLFFQKKSYKEIAEYLNERGYKTKRNGNRFAKNSLYEILGNKKYIGIYEYGKICTKIVGRRKKYAPAQEDKIIVIEDGCPAIIEKSLFEKVQIMRESRQRTVNPRAEVDYMLRGKIRCARCGAAYVGSAMKSHGEKCYYYICSGKKNGKECDNRNIKKDVIENRVIEEIKKRYLSNDGIVWVTKVIKEYNQRTAKPISAAERDATLNIIDQLENRLTRQKEAFYNGVITIAELKSDKEAIDKELDVHKQKLVDTKEIDIDAKGVARIIEKYQQSLVTDRNIIDMLIESVLIDGENITVTLYTSPFDDGNPPKGGSNDNSDTETCENKDQNNPIETNAKDNFAHGSPPPKSYNPNLFITKNFIALLCRYGK